MSTVIQKHRLIAVQTPLGPDKLVFRHMQAQEQLGRLFDYQLDLLSEDYNINHEDLLGKNATVRIELPDGQGTRYYNGFISRFAFTGTYARYASYQMTLRPWLWFLTRSADCRIYQEMTVPDIIKQVFRDNGFTDFSDRLSGTYHPREYCVQYRETAFNFISRLMEQEGMYYYCKHENGKHTVVLSDSRGAHEPFPGYETVPYYPFAGHNRRTRDHLFEWSVTKQVQPGIRALNDFDFKAPRKDLRSVLSQPRGHALADFEIYDYPGEYVERSEGENYARIRHEEMHSQYETVQGRGNAVGLTVGALFTLDNHFRSNQNREYLITGARYELISNEYISGAAGESTSYECSITAIDANQPFRTPCTTPKPLIQGAQTAIVVGPAGEEIYTDQYGRVKCQFHWDRYGKADENSSCWVRVAQLWAGKGWGAMFIPRIGQEVIVDFLEGDPDRPIITGRVYNGLNMPSYALPDQATKSTIKTNSSKGGGGFNEIRFEDKKGEEQIFIHGEFDQDIRIKHDAKEWIGRDRHLIVKRDQLEKVEQDKHLTVLRHQKEEVRGDKHQQVRGDHNQKVTGTLSIDVKSDTQQKTLGNYALEATTGEIHLKAGTNVVIEGNMQLTLKVGPNFIVIDPSGVTIQGITVRINSGGSPGSGMGSSPEAPEAPTAPLEADNAQAGQVEDTEARPITTTPKSPDSVQIEAFEPQIDPLARAAQSGTPFCEICQGGGSGEGGGGGGN